MKPNLKLIINVKKDTANAKDFVKYGDFLNWFLPSNFQFIDSKKFSLAEKNKILTEYTKHIYKINKKEITAGVEQTKKQWSNVEKSFYKLVNKIFQGYPWPKGNYTGYASIYHMFPRHIEEKVFFFPYKSNKMDPRLVIAHEMLHFIFFDYIKNKYKIGEHTKIKGKEPKYVWKISETFNVVMRNWQPYMKLFGITKKEKPYHQGYERMFKKMTVQWSKEQNIKKLLDKWLIK